jgi:hypothetical protein
MNGSWLGGCEMTPMLDHRKGRPQCFFFFFFLGQPEFFFFFYWPRRFKRNIDYYNEAIVRRRPGQPMILFSVSSHSHPIFYIIVQSRIKNV